MDAATGFVEARRAAWMLGLLNDWQRDFPLVERPFAAIGQRYGIGEADVLAGYAAHAQAGALSRIGAVWAAGAGGAALLCAMRVPEARLAEVAHQVSAHPGVNHNYEREHAFNLWFVITGRDAAAVEAGVRALEQASGVRAMRLPMQRVYRIDLSFDLQQQARACAAHEAHRRVPPVRAEDAALAALAEAGLPLMPRPYAHWAQALGHSGEAVLATLRQWQEQGTLRRFGVVVRHHEVGFDQNAMTVIEVPDAEVDARAAILARQPGVTLCYRRARAEGWPYNLYFMVHGRRRDEVRAQIAQALAASGLAEQPHNVLFSRRRFKQAGARYFRDRAGAPHAAG